MKTVTGPFEFLNGLLERGGAEVTIKEDKNKFVSISTRKDFNSNQ